MKSDTATILYGMPQGCILEALVFLIVINDLPNVSETTLLILFANDINLFISHHDIKALISEANKALKKISSMVEQGSPITFPRAPQGGAT